MKTIITLDVAYTNIGWAIVEPYEDGAKIVAAGNVENKAPKGKKKRGIRSSDIKIERIQRLFRETREVFLTHSPHGLVAEIPGGGGKSSRAVAGMALGTAVAAIVGVVEGLPSEWTVEADGKVAVCGHRDASKKEMQTKILKLYPELKKLIPKGRTSLGVPGWFEHTADAIAAYEAAKHGMLVQLIARDNGKLPA